MFEVSVQRPHPALLGVVRSFTQRRGQFVGLSVIKPLHARPDQFLEFYFRESYQVDHGAEGFQATPRAVLVGPTLSPGRTRMSIVYVASPGGWKIAHGHNEDIDEHAAQFDPIRGAPRKG